VFSEEITASSPAEMPPIVEIPSVEPVVETRVRSPACEAALARQAERTVEITAYRNRVMPRLVRTFDERKARLALCLQDVEQCIPTTKALDDALREAEAQFLEAREAVASMETTAFPFTQAVEEACRVGSIP
jgi:hypothetical protein